MIGAHPVRGGPRSRVSGPVIGDEFTDWASSLRASDHDPRHAQLEGHHDVHPYLFFTGTCREAFTRYQEIFGGEVNLMTMAEVPPDAAAQAPEGAMPPGSENLIMHASLKVGDALLMASDDPSGDGGPKKGAAVAYTTGDAGEAKRIFDALAEGGEITLPFGETFWSPAFGMCTDRFGVPWMVDVEAQPT